MTEPTTTVATSTPAASSPKGAASSLYQSFSKVARSLGEEGALEKLAPDFKRLQMGLFRLVVMGEIKKGKSSFINGLLGEPDLLPIASDIATSTVYKIIYGKTKSVRVYFKPDPDTGYRRDPLQVQPAEMNEWGTEAGNPGNKKKVDFIGVQVPAPFLAQGIAIVDTPGVGGLFRSHREITMQYAPNADAVLFVLDSAECVISRDEINFLKDLVKTSTSRIFFVQTKTDTAHEEVWRSWEKRNKEILSKEIGIPENRLVYFPVSANLKQRADRKKSGAHLESSGYLNVLSYLNNTLIPMKEAVMARDFAMKLMLELARMENQQKNSIRILMEESREALENIQSDLLAKKKEMAEWGNTRYREIVQEFQDCFTDLRRKASRQITNEMDPLGPMVTNVVQILQENKELKAQHICEQAEAIQQGLLSDVGETSYRIVKEFNQSYEKLVLDLFADLARDMPSAIDALERTSDMQTLLTAEKVEVNLSLFESMRTGLYGGMAGSMFATIGVSLVGLIFPPALMLAGIAPFLGAWVGGGLAGDNRDLQQKNEAIAKLKSAMEKQLARSQKLVVQKVEDMATTMERETRKIFQDVVQRSQEDMQKQIEEIQQVGKQTREEKNSAVTEAKQKIEQLQRIRSGLEKLIKA